MEELQTRPIVFVIHDIINAIHETSCHQILLDWWSLKRKRDLDERLSFAGVNAICIYMSRCVALANDPPLYIPQSDQHLQTWVTLEYQRV